MDFEDRKESSVTMKITCLTTLCVLILFGVSCFAAQNATKVTTLAPTSSPTKDVAWHREETLPQTTEAYFPLQPMPFSQETGPQPQFSSRRVNSPGSSSPLPLLSCIGAGMALGGLISARWWEHHRDK
jgi:hypothetical protein